MPAGFERRHRLERRQSISRSRSSSEECPQSPALPIRAQGFDVHATRHGAFIDPASGRERPFEYRMLEITDTAIAMFSRCPTLTDLQQRRCDRMLIYPQPRNAPTRFVRRGERDFVVLLDAAGSSRFQYKVGRSGRIIGSSFYPPGGGYVQEYALYKIDDLESLTLEELDRGLDRSQWPPLRVEVHPRAASLWDLRGDDLGYRAYDDPSLVMFPLDAGCEYPPSSWKCNGGQSFVGRLRRLHIELIQSPFQWLPYYHGAARSTMFVLRGAVAAWRVVSRWAMSFYLTFSKAGEWS